MVRSRRSLLKRLFTPIRPIRRHSSRLRVLNLEDRWVPATFTVTTTADSGAGSLRAAIDSANTSSGADIIDATGVTGTISLVTALSPITGSVTIDGPVLSGGLPQLTVKPNSPFSGFRIFDIANGDSNPGIGVTLERLTVQGGFILGGGTSSNDGRGGGIRFIGAADTTGNSLTITDCQVVGNTALAANSSGGSAFGGGVYTSNVAVTLTGSTVSGNRSSGAIGSTAAGSAYGGGLFCSGGSVTITGSAIANNSAVALAATGTTVGNAFGGGLDTKDAALTLTNTAITGNTATGSSSYYGGNATGGGLYHNGLSATLTRVTVTGNVAQGGTGDQYYVYTAGGYAKGGTADGGGLAVTITSNGQFQMTDSQVLNNQAKGGKATAEANGYAALGGIAANGGLDVTTWDNSDQLAHNGTATRCTFAFNSATGGEAVTDHAYSAWGGTGYAGGVTVSQLVNSTVYGNSANGGQASATNQFGGVVVPGPAAGGGFGGGMLFLTSRGFVGGSDAGFLFSDLTVPYSIFNSTIAANVATGQLKDSSGNVISSNTAVGGGVADGTVVEDTSTGVVSVYVDDHTNVFLYSTLVATNQVNPTSTQVIGPGGHAPDVLGCDTRGHNFIGDTDPAPDNATYEPNFPQDNGFNFDGTPKANSHHDIVGPLSDMVTPYDPKLNAPAYNGGLAQTCSLQSISPAIDAGENDPTGTVHPAFTLTYDQRNGFPAVRTIRRAGPRSITPTAPTWARTSSCTPTRRSPPCMPTAHGPPLGTGRRSTTPTRSRRAARAPSSATTPSPRSRMPSPRAVRSSRRTRPPAR